MVGDDTVIKWRDSVIEEYARKQLGKQTGNITVNDVKEIHEIEIISQSIKSLEDFHYFTSL